MHMQMNVSRQVLYITAIVFLWWCLACSLPPLLYNRRCKYVLAKDLVEQKPELPEDEYDELVKCAVVPAVLVPCCACALCLVAIAFVLRRVKN